MMKKIFTLCFLLSFQLLNAQVCDYWYALKSGNQFSWNMYNAKAKLTGTLNYTIANAASGTNSFDVHSVMKDEKGKETYSSDLKMSCSENDLLIDMKNFIPQSSMDAYKDMQLKFEGSSLDFPSVLNVGATLSDGTVTMTVNNNDMLVTTISVNVKERKIESKESVTTPAGTFECYKISSTSEMITTTFGMKIPVTMKTMEYYCSGTGLIKSESYSKDGKLMSYMELASLVK